MTKRISCFVLALVMVLAAVPVFALTAFASETGHTSAWRDNLPSYTQIVADADYDVTYSGAWLIGNVDKSADYNTGFQLFDSWTKGDKANKLITTRCDDPQWNVGGLYLGGQGGRALQFITTASHYTAVRYVAEYSGSVTLDIASLQFSNAEDTARATAGHALAIVLNGEIVWPQNATFADETTWYSNDAANTDVASDIDLSGLSLTLEQGDNLDFVFRRLSAAGASWGAYDFAPSVTYTSDVSAQTALLHKNASSYRADVLPITGGQTNLTLYKDWTGTDEEFAAQMQAAYTIAWTGKWSLGVVNNSTGAYETIARRYLFADKTTANQTAWNTAWGVTESAYQKGLALYLSGGSSSPWNTNYGTVSVGTAGWTCVQPSTSNDTLMAYTYEAPVGATYKFSFDSISKPTAPINLAILVDGKMVWPTEGGSLSSVSSFHVVAKDDANAATTVNAALADLELRVEAGSLIQFAVGKGGWAGSAASGQGFCLEPRVSYEAYDERYVAINYYDTDSNKVAGYSVKVGSEFPVPEVYATWDIDGDGVADELPAIVTDAAEIYAVTYYRKDSFAAAVNNETHVIGGNWSIQNGSWNVDFSVEGFEGTPVWTGGEKAEWNAGQYTGGHYTFASRKPEGWGVFGDSLWAANGGGMYTNRKHTTKLPANAANAIVYTAPLSGHIDISFDNLTGTREINANQVGAEYDGPIAFYVTIVKNGEVIWPSNGMPYLYEGGYSYTAVEGLQEGVSLDFLRAEIGETEGTLKAKPTEAFPTNVPVAAGDEIAVVLNSGNSACWFIYADMAVQYTDEVGKPSVTTGAVTLGSAFSATFGVDMGDAPAGSTNLGAFINGEFVAAVDGKVTLSGIAAKEIADDITVVPAVTWEGSVLKGEATVCSVADLLMNYVTDDVNNKESNLAIATLNYAAAAQLFFGENTENLANAELTEAQKAVTFGAYEDGKSISDTCANDVAKFYGVKLMLNDTVDIAVYLKSDIDLTDGYKVTVSVDGNALYETAAIENVGNGLYKVIFTGFTPTSWNTRYALTLVDAEGTAVADTLNYGVVDYCARMQGSEVDAVVDAMLALYEAADAYTA